VALFFITVEVVMKGHIFLISEQEEGGSSASCPDQDP